ncbi:MAG: RluA family pseudouridine synthase [Fretibacterium sp.]|nr:RluA family pseudouridine synthase [Fretibacterium sp.]
MKLTVINSGTRLDVFLSCALGVTRSFAQRLIREGRVSGVGKLKPSARVQEGEACTVALPEPEGMEIEPEPVDFGVVHEDEDLIVVNKPAGLVVHPAPGHWRGTLVHGLLWRYPDMKQLRNHLRPGIVHRLDATTSGLMVVARRQSVMEALQRMFQERQVTKQYLALIHGTPASGGTPEPSAARRGRLNPATSRELLNFEGTLSGPIARDPDNPLRMAVIDGGRPALTGYRVLWNRRGLSLVVCSLFTGRTHQIRVHMAALGHPLVGDTLYGAPKDGGGVGAPLNGRVFLHSWKLAFDHPVTGVALSFRLPLPEELREYLRKTL